jgi:hypothetical protein
VTFCDAIVIVIHSAIDNMRREEHENKVMSPKDVAVLNTEDRAVVEAYWMASHAPITYKIFNDAKSENDLRMANESAMEDQRSMLIHH